MDRIEFSGNFSHTIDSKGRVTIPAAYREALGSRFTIGLNNDFRAVALYPAEKWEKKSEALKRIPDSDIRGIKYVRMIQGNSFPDCELDAQGRLLVPPTLRKKALLEKDIRFVGLGEYLEVWDEALYSQMNQEAEENIESLLDYVNDRYYTPSHE